MVPDRWSSPLAFPGEAAIALAPARSEVSAAAFTCCATKCTRDCDKRCLQLQAIILRTSPALLADRISPRASVWSFGSQDGGPTSHRPKVSLLAVSRSEDVTATLALPLTEHALKVSSASRSPTTGWPTSHIARFPSTRNFPCSCNGHSTL